MATTTGRVKTCHHRCSRYIAIAHIIAPTSQRDPGWLENDTIRSEEGNAGFRKPHTMKKLALEEHFIAPGCEEYWEPTVADFGRAVHDQILGRLETSAIAASKPWTAGE